MMYFVQIEYLSKYNCKTFRYYGSFLIVIFKTVDVSIIKTSFIIETVVPQVILWEDVKFSGRIFIILLSFCVKIPDLEKLLFKIY